MPYLFLRIQDLKTTSLYFPQKMSSINKQTIENGMNKKLFQMCEQFPVTYFECKDPRKKYDKAIMYKSLEIADIIFH